MSWNLIALGLLVAIVIAVAYWKVVINAADGTDEEGDLMEFLDQHNAKVGREETKNQFDELMKEFSEQQEEVLRMNNGFTATYMGGSTKSYMYARKLMRKYGMSEQELEALSGKLLQMWKQRFSDEQK